MADPSTSGRRGAALVGASSEKWTLVVSCLSVALVIGSMAALYTSLPDIAATTGATQSELTWVVDGYTLALACLVLPAGALGDRYGRRAALIVGLIVFSAASLIPLAVQEPMWLIAARAVAGVGAAFVMPSTLSLLTAGVPEHHRGRAVGIWAGVAGSGAVLGILASGLLLEVWSWQSIFIGLAGAGVVLLVAASTLSESRDESPPPMDYVGSVLVAVAIGLVVVAVTEAPVRGWTDLLVLGLAGGGIVALTGFVVVELRRRNPLLDLRLFAHRGFGSGTLSITLHFLVMFGVFLLLVQYLQLVMGYRPLQSAVALAPIVVPLVLISLFATRLSDRFGLRSITVTGLVVMAAGLYLTSRLGVDAAYLELFWPLTVMGTGLGLCTAPATAAIVGAVPDESQGVAAAVNDAARELGAAVGIAIAGSVLAARYTDGIASTLPAVPAAAREPFTESLAAALQVVEASGPSAQHLADVAKAAFVDGIAQASTVLAVISAASAVILTAWAPGRQRRQPLPAPEQDAPTAGHAARRPPESSNAAGAAHQHRTALGAGHAEKERDLR